MSSPIVVNLPESLTIANAEALHQQLEAVVEKHINVTLNAESVSRVDTAGLQLLHAFCVEQRDHQLTVDWVSMTSILKDSAELLGLSESLAFAP